MAGASSRKINSLVYDSALLIRRQEGIYKIHTTVEEVGMWPKEPITGSWIDCLYAIEKSVRSLKRMANNGPHENEFTRKLASHEARTRFDEIWRYAGKAVKDLER
jgi:hypothetical protein